MTKGFFRTSSMGFAHRARPVLLTLMIAALAASGAARAPTSPTATRPISDFLSTQGTYCIDDGMGGCLLFVPPVANFIGWTAPASGTLFALVDYAGLADAYIVSNGGTSLGTTMDGTVIEYPLADGRAHVTVVLHTKNALTWVSDIESSFPGPLQFGHFAPDVLAGADAALGESTLKWVFINTAPGAPLPDLIELLNHLFGAIPEDGHETISMYFVARASGTLRAEFGVDDGTPGRAHITQTGTLLRTPFKGKGTADGFPAEIINLRVVGK